MKVLVYQVILMSLMLAPFRHELAQASKSSFEQYAKNTATTTSGITIDG